MSHITTEKANQLFWLGRYVERVYTTVIEYFKGYDRMIDEAADPYANIPVFETPTSDVFGEQELKV